MYITILLTGIVVHSIIDDIDTVRNCILIGNIVYLITVGVDTVHNHTIDRYCK